MAGKKLIKKLLFSVICLSLTHCAGQASEPIMTDERFNSRQLDDGTTEFVFGISWKYTSAEPLQSNNQRDADRPPPRSQEFDPRQSAGGPRFAVQADNETKLALEDQAAESLQKRIEKENLCPEGHQINRVIWQADNITLLGQCF